MPFFDFFVDAMTSQHPKSIAKTCFGDIYFSATFKKQKMVHSKRKHAAAVDDISSSHGQSEPVNVDSLSSLLSFNTNGNKDIYDMKTTIQDMKSSSTHFIQLNVLQQLKGRVSVISKNNNNNENENENKELIEILSWLISLYLMDESKLLRKTLVSVIGVLYDNISIKNNDDVMKCINDIMENYYNNNILLHINKTLMINNNNSSFTIIETHNAVSTLVSIFELSLLNNILLNSNDKIDGILKYLNLHLDNHLKSVTTLQGTKTR